jgi:hypothetical protein
MKLDQIEEIYQQYNICKVIFVCRCETFVDYMRDLKDRDFSVVSLNDYSKFNSNTHSTLLINDDIDRDVFMTNVELFNLNDVSMVIYIDTDKEIPCLKHIFSFIL